MFESKKLGYGFVKFVNFINRFNLVSRFNMVRWHLAQTSHLCCIESKPGARIDEEHI